MQIFQIILREDCVNNLEICITSVEKKKKINTMSVFNVKEPHWTYKLSYMKYLN